MVSPEHGEWGVHVHVLYDNIPVWHQRLGHRNDDLGVSWRRILSDSDRHYCLRDIQVASQSMEDFRLFMGVVVCAVFNRSYSRGLFCNTVGVERSEYGVGARDYLWKGPNWLVRCFDPMRMLGVTMHRCAALCWVGDTSSEKAAS